MLFSLLQELRSDLYNDSESLMCKPRLRARFCFATSCIFSDTHCTQGQKGGRKSVLRSSGRRLSHEKLFFLLAFPLFFFFFQAAKRDYITIVIWREAQNHTATTSRRKIFLFLQGSTFFLDHKRKKSRHLYIGLEPPFTMEQ